jgi:hypothetical protein
MAVGHLMGELSLAVCSKVLLFIMLATLCAKLAVEGAHTLPKYCPRRGKKVLGEPQCAPRPATCHPLGCPGGVVSLGSSKLPLQLRLGRR